MSVRPTPDGAPRPVHRSRLAHVLRIGADRAASTEVPFLWDGGDGPKVPICVYETDRENVYELDRRGRPKRVCDERMEDADDNTRRPEWRAGQMEALITAGDRAGVMEKLEDTEKFYEFFSTGDYPRYWGQREWATHFQITDTDAAGKNLFVMALERKQPEIFNDLWNHYINHGDLVKKMDPSGQQDTSLRRFDVPSGKLIELALKNLVDAEEKEYQETRKVSWYQDNDLITTQHNAAFHSEEIAKKLIRFGFDMSRGIAYHNELLLSMATIRIAPRVRGILTTVILHADLGARQHP